MGFLFFIVFVFWIFVVVGVMFDLNGVFFIEG